MARCKSIRSDGEPCKAIPMRGGDFCWWHDAATRAQMLEACRQGGLNRRRPVILPEVEPLSPAGTRAILAGVLEALLVGALNDKTARSVGYLLGIDAKLFEIVELEKRVAALEDLPGLSRES